MSDTTSDDQITRVLDCTEKSEYEEMNNLVSELANQLQAIKVCAELIQEIPYSKNASSLMEYVLQIEESVSRCEGLLRKARDSQAVNDECRREKSLVTILMERVEALHMNTDHLLVDIKIETHESTILANDLLEYLLEMLLNLSLRQNHSGFKHIWIELTTNENVYELKISDNRNGIKDAVNRVLINPMYRLDEISHYISHEEIERYGWKIEAQDRIAGRPDLGSAFVLKLPKAEETIT